jgi:glucosyl-dolichyl phosphate glucuronosyltransferase
MSSPSVSIIICTRNRAEHLRKTLEAIARVGETRDHSAELILVDNGSTDHTADVARDYKPAGMTLRYVRETRPGLSVARNTGLAHSTGDIILFTDDDVRPCDRWIDGMCDPICAGRGEAVAGGVRFAPHLERPWMTDTHRAWLASTDRLKDKQDDLADIVGANMAFSRAVLATVPGFDSELGAGALGFGDETLFAWQMREAGYRIAPALSVEVEHHFDTSRLLRSAFLRSASMQGRAQAYLAHHWKHKLLPHPLRKLARSSARLCYARTRRTREWRIQEGCALWEMLDVMQIWYCRQYLREQKRPRNYDLRGLVKINGGCATSVGS